MDVASYYRSLTTELDSLKDRVRNFIAGAHWLTDGEWKESVLRAIFARKLPETVRVGRGFILTQHGPTTQCDILLYKASAPILFREGELVFLTPDAVLGIIEVKSAASMQVVDDVLDKFAEIGRQLGSDRSHCFFGLFAYDNKINNDQRILDALRAHCDHDAKIVDFISLGCSTFVRWWKFSPRGSQDHYERWHSYELPNMSAGYFITNVIDYVSPESVGRNAWLWFPEDSKEARKTGDISFQHALNQ